MIDVTEITRLHRETVQHWHQEPLANPYRGFLHTVCEQHKYNFQLWHEEDLAHSPRADEARIAAVKRTIDSLNQKRNDWIEKLDDFLLTELHCLAVAPEPGARLNTETPGSAIDRLSVLALRLYHLEEQARRADAPIEHVSRARERLDLLSQQHQDLSASLAELLTDIFAGRKRLRVYRHFKMYGDMAANPHMAQPARWDATRDKLAA